MPGSPSNLTLSCARELISGAAERVSCAGEQISLRSLQLEKVLQPGDISEVAEPYMRDDKVRNYLGDCCHRIMQT